MDRVQRHAAVHPRVQVAIAGPHLHLDPDEAAGRELDRRDVAPQHPAVEDHAGVGAALVLRDVVGDRVAADLLLAVERDAKVDGQRAGLDKPMRRMSSQTHSPARFTSSRWAGSALTLGIAISSASSARQASSTRRDSTEIVRASAERTRLVLRIEQRAGAERQTAAADTRRQSAADRLERRNALVELEPPAAREPLPVALRRRLAGGERLEGSPDPLERDPGCLSRLQKRDAPQRDGRVAPLVAVRAPRRDEPLALVETERRLRNAAACGELADGQLP